MDRCGKLSSSQGPEFAQAGHGFAPGSIKIEPDPDPPDKPLGPLRDPGERGVDEVADRLDDEAGRGKDLVAAFSHDRGQGLCHGDYQRIAQLFL